MLMFKGCRRNLEKFTALSTDERATIFKAMIRFNQVMEEEAFQFVLGMINAKTEKIA